MLLLTTNPVLLLTRMNMVYHGVIIIINVHSFLSCSMFLYMLSMEPSHSGILPAHFRDNQWLPTRKKATPARSTRCSMYGIFSYIWVIFRVNVGKYSIHGAYGSTNLGTYLRRNFGPHGFGMSGGQMAGTDGWII